MKNKMLSKAIEMAIDLLEGFKLKGEGEFIMICKHNPWDVKRHGICLLVDQCYDQIFDGAYFNVYHWLGQYEHKFYDGENAHNWFPCDRDHVQNRIDALKFILNDYSTNPNIRFY